MPKCSYKILLQSKCFACVQETLAICGGLTLTGFQVLTKASVSTPVSWTGVIRKDSWVEMSKERDHSPVMILGTIDSSWGTSLSLYQSNQSGLREVIPNLYIPFPYIHFTPALPFCCSNVDSL